MVSVLRSEWLHSFSSASVSSTTLRGMTSIFSMGVDKIAAVDPQLKIKNRPKKQAIFSRVLCRFGFIFLDYNRLLTL